MPEQKLSEDRIDIWRVSLSLPASAVGRLAESLDDEERKKAGQFRFERDRMNYLASRGALRTILSKYLDEPPEALRFRYGPYGKPFLSNHPAADMPAFNLSHSTDLTLIAVASSRRVGIDVERIRDIPELEDIVEAHFSAKERASLAAADAASKRGLFFSLWTRREAAAKARGLDLSAALSDLDIPMYPPGGRVEIEEQGHCTWSIQDLPLGPFHAAALCSEGKSCETVIRDLDPVPGSDTH